MAHSDGRPDVEFRRVTRSYGDFLAVENLSFTVQRGEFFTLLGPSGSGKSTTLRLIAGFERPTTGDVLLRGRDVKGLPPYKRETSTVFQNYALFPHLTVRENVEYGLRVRGEPKDRRRTRALRMLELVRLAQLADRSVRNLSGGEKQRVALARSLVTEPTVLLLDEPLGALDEKLRQEMQVELKRLQQEVGITFVYVTHVQEEALSMSDRMAVMNQGRLEQVGPPEAVYYHPMTRFVADFIGAANILTGPGARISSDTVQVDICGQAVLTTDSATLVRQGDELSLCVRPERVAVGTDAADKHNRLFGSILAERFRGASYEYLLVLNDGQRIRAETLGRLSGAGSTVLLGWDHDDAVLVQ
jgi:spermidine/putrescine transport system ATP-binding protein